MKNTDLIKELNYHVNYEMYSSYLYRGMQIYFGAVGLNGFAHWMSVQAGEEMLHSLKFIAFMQDRDYDVKLGKIDDVPTDYTDTLQVFQEVLTHERTVSTGIHQLLQMSKEANDFPLQVMLQFFVNEQVEEEKNAKQIVDNLKLVGKDGSGLLMLDREMMQRPTVSALRDTNA